VRAASTRNVTAATAPRSWTVPQPQSPAPTAVSRGAIRVLVTSHPDQPAGHQRRSVAVDHERVPKAKPPRP